MPQPTDTISAIATPPGIGGVGIIRVSGALAPAIARHVCGRLPPARMAMRATFREADEEVIDDGLLLYFPAPHSFTGEDVVELQCHGGQFTLQRLLQRTLELGARVARAGEFSERAFVNDKLDLLQAEAIADLIESGTEAAARAAQRSLQGVFSARVEELQQQLTELRVFVEAAIDFPEEEVDFLAESDIGSRVDELSAALAALLSEARQGCLLRDGIVMAIVGAPNAGKSSLLNALSGQDSAIVTDIPGTTRDVLREWIDVDGIPVHVADTAGLRETADVIEAEGVRRARQALDAADLVLLVEDVTTPAATAPTLPAGKPCVRVANKIDLLEPGGRALLEQESGDDRVAISARSGDGLDRLRRRIRQTLGVVVGLDGRDSGAFSARQRHVDALERAGRHLAVGVDALRTANAGELLAEELRLAQQAFGELTGELLPDDLLGAIFSSFCIGK